MNKFESMDELIESIDDWTMVKDCAETMLFELLHMDKGDQLRYLEDLLEGLKRPTLEAYYDELGCLQYYLESLNET
jgi:hypothetical protein